MVSDGIRLDGIQTLQKMLSQEDFECVGYKTHPSADRFFWISPLRLILLQLV